METKFRIIETPSYILAVSEEEIQNGYYYNDLDKALRKGYAEQSYHTSVIGYLPKGDAKKLDLPLLPELVLQDDKFESFLDREINFNLSPKTTIERIKWYYQTYFKATTNVYSEADLRKAVQFGIDKCHYGLQHKTKAKETMINDFIQSHKQPKTPKWFVAETETVKGKYIGRVQIGITPSGEPIRINEGYEEIQRLKNQTINGKTYLVGKYLYE
jgi:hypothetical protein